MTVSRRLNCTSHYHRCTQQLIYTARSVCTDIWCAALPLGKNALELASPSAARLDSRSPGGPSNCPLWCVLIVILVGFNCGCARVRVFRHTVSCHTLVTLKDCDGVAALDQHVEGSFVLSIAVRPMKSGFILLQGTALRRMGVFRAMLHFCLCVTRLILQLNNHR